MKVLLFGYGSIGKRHAANLRALRPDVELGIYDPPLGMTTDMRPDAAIIASPTVKHATQMASMAAWGVPFYVEKPMGADDFASLPDYCAIGFQYRFHPNMPKILATRAKLIWFLATDDLLERYGPDVDGAMAAHPIDTALWFLGPARAVNLHSNGISFHGYINHHGGATSHYNMRMDAKERSSIILCGNRTIDLPANDAMYRDALAAWLAWVGGAERDPRTATLADGLAVEHVLQQVKHASPA